jgi:DUF4097 and DUF4098 domain-containing protein YvlB
MKRSVTMRTSIHKIWVGVLALALMAGGPVLAGRSVNESIDAGNRPSISIEILVGSVTVVGSSGSTVEISGTIGDDVEELRVEKHGNRIEISVELPNGNHKRDLDADAKLEILVPFASELSIETVAADIEVRDVRGSMSLESVAGTVEVEGAGDELEVETVAGSIRVTGSTLQEASFESVAGNIRVEGDLSDSGEFSFETVSGNITLTVPSGFSAEWEVETFSGSIDNDLGPAAERTSQYAPGRELHFVSGGGGAEVSIETLSGSVEIRTN